MTDLTKAEFKKLIQNLEALPSISSSLNRIMKILDDPRSSAKNLTEALRLDQSITSKLLKVVNSVYFGFPRRIDALDQAVTILGYRSIRNLVMITTIFEEMDRQYRETCWDREAFWLHAVGCGAAAKVIAQKTETADGEEAFLAGLLHDIGKVFLDAFMHEEYQDVLQRAGVEGLLLHEAERKYLGAGHAEFGGWLADEWNLPLNLTAAINFHHEPARNRDHYTLVCLVHVGDILAQALEIGTGGQELLPAVDRQAWASLHLTPALLKQILPAIDQELTRAQIFMPGK